MNKSCSKTKIQIKSNLPTKKSNAMSFILKLLNRDQCLYLCFETVSQDYNLKIQY